MAYNPEKESSRESLSKKLSDIEPIEKNREVKLESGSDLANLVEGPLLSACKELWGKNIITEGSSANRKDLIAEHPEAWIVINYDKLSDKNRSVAESLGEVGYADEHNQIRINIPIDQDSTWGDVQEKAEAIVRRFTKQRFRADTRTLGEAKQAAAFDPSATMEEIRTRLGIDPDDVSFGPESLSNWYWVPEKQLFYISKEQYEKSLEEVNEAKT